MTKSRGIYKKWDTQSFIEKATEVHHGNYLYDESTVFTRLKDKIAIICPKHGKVHVVARNHLNGHGCPLCAVEESVKKRLVDKASLVNEFRKIHGDKYDYQLLPNELFKTSYIDVICPIHGAFRTRANYHLNGRGCPKCNHRNKTTEDFISELRSIYGEDYDYSKVEYKNNKAKVCLICHNKDSNEQEHGEWLVKPNDLISKHVKCPKCLESHLEKEVRKILETNGIEFVSQMKFPWLKSSLPLSLDFYLPQYNIAIECQGIQHFEVIEYFGGEEHFLLRKSRDELKNRLCIEHGINILYVVENGLNIEGIIENSLIYNKHNVVKIKELKRKLLDGKTS